MALISQSIKNLKGGISQQPDILRYPDQGAEQVNGWSSETEGLQKRPPMVFTKTIATAGAFGAKPLVHLINRDAFEKYQVVFTGSGIRVFDLAGKEYSVSGDMSYVTTASPQDDLRMVTVADYTFIVNRNKVVATSKAYTNGNAYRPQGDCLINVRGGQFGRTLTVNINGTVVASLVMPDGSQAAHTAQTDAQYIVNQIVTKIKAALPSWTCWGGAGYVYVAAPAGTNITAVTTTDGYAGQLINAVTHEAQTFTKLPLEAPSGYMVRINGQTSSTDDRYYVAFDALNKVWKETVGWNVETGLNASTMPQALVRQADGSFKLQTLPWANRSCGDDDTNPMPSLVGGKINDVFFFRNRLGFLSGENIVMSRTSKYFNLFPASVANLSDDDPIDVAVSHNRISILKYAVPFSEELLLWSDQAQFVLTSSGILSSKTIELNLTTEFDVSDTARPYGIGRGVYFAAPRASFSSLKRYYAVQDVSAVKDAEDMSAHVPSYVPNGVFSIHGSGTENFVAMLTNGAPNRVYIYKYLYLDSEIRQQSWSHWEFGNANKVLAAQCIGSKLYLILQNDYHIWMSSVHFTKSSIDLNNEPYRLYIDDKRAYTVPTGLYNDDTYLTTIDLYDAGYARLSKYGDVYLVATDGQVHEGICPAGGWPNGRPVIKVSGDWTGKQVFLGFLIDFRYEFSKFLIKKSADDGTTATEDIGRLQLRRAWLNYEDSGAFNIEVENNSRLFSYEMSGARLGSDQLRVGYLNVGTGQFRFPLVGNANANIVRLVSKTTTPLNVIGCGWEGNYLRRSSGI